jgi:hypothetical protein
MLLHGEAWTGTDGRKAERGRHLLTLPIGESVMEQGRGAAGRTRTAREGLAGKAVRWGDGGTGGRTAGPGAGDRGAAVGGVAAGDRRAPHRRGPAAGPARRTRRGTGAMPATARRLRRPGHPLASPATPSPRPLQDGSPDPLQRTVHPVYFGGVRTPGTVRPAPQNLCRAAPEEAARSRKRAGGGRADRQAEGGRKGRAEGRRRAARRTVRRGMPSASSRVSALPLRRRRRLGPCALLPSSHGAPVFRSPGVRRCSPVFSGSGVPSSAGAVLGGRGPGRDGEAGDVRDIGDIGDIG